MEVGQQIRRARLEAGLSQRQLCEDLITRNMLSLIENGSALPSLPTLEALAGRLGKPVGYFFGEDTVPVSKDPRKEIWEALAKGEPSEAETLLGAAPGDLFGPGEKDILEAGILLQMAEKAIREDRRPYAVSLLKQAGRLKIRIPELERRRILLLGELEGESAVSLARQLPSMDGELLLRAKAALEEKNLQRAGELLDAAEDRQSPQWNLLRGKVWYSQALYVRAVRCFQLAERSYPRETARYLEVCYRELEDFKQAYFYACRQKEL